MAHHEAVSGNRKAGSQPGKIGKDIAVLAAFIEIYCRGKHAGRERAPARTSGPLASYLAPVPVSLCAECRKLLLHGASKRLICPYDPKPRCKKCPSHCYGPDYRERIREVMRYSGLHLIMRGRLDWLWRYFF